MIWLVMWNCQMPSKYDRAQLERLIAADMSASQIAYALNVSRNAAIAAMARMGLHSHGVGGNAQPSSRGPIVPSRRCAWSACRKPYCSGHMRASGAVQYGSMVV